MRGQFLMKRLWAAAGIGACLFFAGPARVGASDYFLALELPAASRAGSGPRGCVASRAASCPASSLRFLHGLAAP